MKYFAVVVVLVACVGCGGGGGVVITATGQGAPLVLTAGVVGLDPAPDAAWAAGLDLAALGLGDISAFYDLTTPAGEAFVFDVLSRNAGNAGLVRVSIAHAADGGAPPAGGIETLAEAGVVPSATAPTYRDRWLDCHGDGFVRLTLRGTIDRPQVLALRADDGNAVVTALVRVAIGARSPINVAEQSRGDYPGVLVEDVVYTSNSWLFGLPAIAVSGDRTSVVVYEGDGFDPHAPTRFELRLQVDHATGEVTGGASEEANPDSGHWRDHDLAALFNVLALANSAHDRVTVRLSFDRGATFGQTEVFAVGGSQSRLCTVAMAADYSLALLFWRSAPGGGSELVLVEGRPSAFDAVNSPTQFEFDPEFVIYADSGDVTPVLMGATWSDTGVLAVGYGFTQFRSNPDGTWTSRFVTRCAVRPFGGVFDDVLVDEDVLIGKDPSVSIVGNRLFIAYEGRTGVLLKWSDDDGRSFSAAETIGDGSAHTPTVIAREQEGNLRVDVLYLAQGPEGQELHLRHWDDFGRTPGQDFRLTRATTERTPGGGGGGPPPPGVREDFAIVPPDGGLRITQVAWFGYAAAADGDDIEVIVHEETFDGYFFILGAPIGFGAREEGAGPFLPAADQFVVAEPPPLADGLTGGPVKPNDENDRSKAIRYRID